MRLDHLLSKEERSRGFLLLSIVGLSSNLKFLVAMRSGATPVPIPNTMVKTWTADGTALETVWESRWPPNLKEKDEDGNAVEVKNKYRYGRTTIRRANPISRAVLLTLGLPVIRVQKKFWVLMTDKQSVRNVPWKLHTEKINDIRSYISYTRHPR